MALTQKVRQEVLAVVWCVYCGALATQVDHIIPRSRGGSDELKNLAAACKLCNMEKLDFTPEEWREWREAEGLGWPPAPWHEEPKIKAILAEWKERNPGRLFPRLTTTIARRETSR